MPLWVQSTAVACAWAVLSLASGPVVVPRSPFQLVKDTIANVIWGCFIAAVGFIAWKACTKSDKPKPIATKTSLMALDSLSIGSHAVSSSDGGTYFVTYQDDGVWFAYGDSAMRVQMDNRPLVGNFDIIPTAGAGVYFIRSSKSHPQLLYVEHGVAAAMKEVASITPQAELQRPWGYALGYSMGYNTRQKEIEEELENMSTYEYEGR